MMNTHIVKVAMLAVIGGLALGSSACSMVFRPAYRDANGAVTATASVNSSDLKVGDCIYNVSGGGTTVTKLQVVPCTSEHEAEVYATQTNVANDTTSLQQFCEDQYKPYIGVDFADTGLDVTFIHNDATSAKTDLQCIVYSQGNMVTTSYKGSKQ